MVFNDRIIETDNACVMKRLLFLYTVVTCSVAVRKQSDFPCSAKLS